MQSSQSENGLLEAALSYAAKSWPVFPCAGKKPKTAHGVHDATVKSWRIEKWWKEYPHANIGIATGQGSQLLVLDIDVKNGGLESLETLKHEWGHDAFYTYTVKTGGGGYHFYYRVPDFSVGNSVGIFPGVDVRADGGYVVAPPSLHESGGVYEIISELPPLSCPAAFVALLLQRKKTPPNPPPPNPNEGSPIVEGGRNNYLIRMAGRLRRSGLSEEALTEALLRENESVCSPPLPEREVGAISAWVIARHAPSDPVAALIDVSAPEPITRISDLIDSMCAYLRDKDLVHGRPTGISGLDKLLGGGKRLGEITAWLGEAKIGKNTLWHYLMVGHLDRGEPVGYASREIDPAREVMPNLLSVKLQKNVWLEPVDEKAYGAAAQNWPLYFSKGFGNFPFEEIEKWVAVCKGLGVVSFWFDHLHYMLEEPEEYKEASKLIKRLKTLALREKIHIDIIIQPTKLDVEKKEKMGRYKLRGGTAIEQGIDNLLVLERKVGPGVDPNTTSLKLEFARSKLADPGEIYLRYNKAFFDFVEVEFVSGDNEGLVRRGHLKQPTIDD